MVGYRSGGGQSCLQKSSPLPKMRRSTCSWGLPAWICSGKEEEEEEDTCAFQLELCVGVAPHQSPVPQQSKFGFGFLSQVDSLWLFALNSLMLCMPNLLWASHSMSSDTLFYLFCAMRSLCCTGFKPCVNNLTDVGLELFFDGVSRTLSISYLDAFFIHLC